MNKRLEYLDVAKGFAILLMVFGHIEVTCEPIKVWIYAFHMPLFFVVCGMLIAHRETTNPASLKWDRILKKRLYQLGFPYIIWSLMFVMYLWLMEWIGGEDIQFVGKIKPIVTLKGASVVWFIPCYAIAELMMVLACQYRKSLCVVPIVIFFILYYGEFDALVLARSCMGFTMVGVGYLFSRYVFRKHVPVAWTLPCIIVGSALSAYQGLSDLNSQQFNNLFLYVVTWMLFCFGFITLFMEMVQNHHFDGLVRFLTFWGKNSIVLLCTHMFFIEIIRYVDYKFFDDVVRDSGIIGSIPLTVLVCVLEIPIIKISSSKLHWMFGK